jgi:uncharacterized RDD family membrane protein YckC
VEEDDALDDAPSSRWTARLLTLFRRLFSLSVDLTLIATISFLLWVKHPLLILPCGWAYYAACSAWLGQRTPGMRLAGLHLVETRPAKQVYATAWQSPLCRTVLWGFLLTLASGGLGYFLPLLLLHDGRTLQECIAGTQFLTQPS